MTTDETLTAILAELEGIRTVLETRPTPPPPHPAAANAANPPTGTPAEIPQPNQVVADAGAQTVHFGKNQGKRLDELGERSVEWYASIKPEKLDSTGKPYPPRPADTALENAARTLYHTRKGTLNTQQLGAAFKAEQSAPVAGSASTDEVPFMRREYDMI